ncbi:MAG: dienelactone hydrolase family protein [Acidimicrobiia bacterium]
MTSQHTESVAVEGGEFDLHVWTPDAGSGPSILLIQEVFGVGPYIRAVAERLAQAGYVVGAPDVFWRIHPNWEADHSEAGLGASIEKVQQLDFPQAIGDCVAALEHLAMLPRVTGRPAVLGFCLGGTLAWGVAAMDNPSCCVSYYGSGVPSMLAMIQQVTCPVLFHFGNQDDYLPSEGVEALNEAIAGLAGFAINVENAGHAFDNHEAEMFYDEASSKSAWAKTMGFLGTHLPV